MRLWTQHQEAQGTFCPFSASTAPVQGCPVPGGTSGARYILPPLKCPQQAPFEARPLKFLLKGKGVGQKVVTVLVGRG